MKQFIKGFIAFVFALVTLSPLVTSAQEDELNVAIVQLVSHPSLDDINAGIIEGLAEIGYEEGNNLTINQQNSEGDMNLLNTIANQVVSEDPDVIFAITTPVAQAFQNATDEIPIMMAGITDPVGAMLVESIEAPGANITGVSDAMSLDVQFELLQEMLPEVSKVGFMYSTNEDNSQLEVEAAAAAAEELGYETQIEGLSSALDMQMVGQNLASQVDVIFIGADNTIASSFATLLDVTDSENIPVITTISDMIEQGALGGVAINQKQIGYQAGLMTQEIIDGTNPGEIPVQFVENPDTLINPETVERLGIELPESVKEKATMIEVE
ncbi:ABC transporter substrate-binding protein [Aerococcaceae bacterium DSM 111176]|nr:ABC transporter substrate-binding protein [Aerococcaceae bacterium DSM 111176]